MMSIFCDLELNWRETADIKALGSSFFLGGPLFIIFKVKGYFGPLKTSVELRATEKKNLKWILILLLKIKRKLDDVEVTISLQ